MREPIQIGPKGKYDSVLQDVVKATGCNSAILLVFDGKQGQGCSVQLSQTLFNKVPAILRVMADAIEGMRNN